MVYRLLRDSLLDPQPLCIEMLDAAWSIHDGEGPACEWTHEPIGSPQPSSLENVRRADEPGQTAHATVDPAFERHHRFDVGTTIEEDGLLPEELHHCETVGSWLHSPSLSLSAT